MAKQAIGRSITPSPLHPRALLEGAVRAFREFIEPEAFAKRAGRTIIFPVADDGWFPAFRTGEFAIVDLDQRIPEENCFMLWRSTGKLGTMAIVRPRLHRYEEQEKLSGARATPQYVVNHKSGEEYWDGAFWWMTFGARCAYAIDGGPADFGGHDRFHMADGPLSDRYMRQQIVGKVIGVLGKPDRALNWRGK